MTTVRLNHLGAALLAAAAAGLLASVGLLVVLYAQPAEANYPGTAGKIYYSGDDGQDYEIYSINPDGGSNVRVTNNQSANWEPAYSPTGKKVAYSGWDGQRLGDLHLRPRRGKQGQRHQQQQRGRPPPLLLT